LAGTVEAICDSPLIWLRNDEAGCAAVVGVALVGVALGVVGVPEVDVDEQAVAARPRPAIAVMILAMRQDFTVLPSLKAHAFHVQPGAMRPAAIHDGQAAWPAPDPDLIHGRVGGVVHPADAGPGTGSGRAGTGAD
jgi:hypothetical protein